MNEPNRGDTGSPFLTPRNAEPDRDSSFGTQKVILVVLLLGVLGTVFLLPRFVTDPWLGGEADQRAQPAPTASTVSPSTAAEKTAYRQESQSVLAKIVSVRDRLRGRNVEQWADIEFKQAQDRVQAGDQQYSYGEYSESLAHFRAALEQMQALESQAESTLVQALADGETAVESLNPNVARKSSELAQMLAPGQPEVLSLAARVEKLPELIALMEQGDTARAQGRLAEALGAFEQAVSIDGAHRRAAESVKAVRLEMTAARFRQHMSQGFASMDSGNYADALAAFDEAEKVRPGDPAIAQARAQVANRNAQATVRSRMQSARALESEEQWAQAMQVYESLLEEDASLAEARARLVPVRVRATLDATLEQLIADPLRLAGENAHRNAQQVLRDARGIAGPGPRLEGQIADLDRMLQLAVSPVNVTFRSDNQTHVTLFRVKELGRFEQTTLTLKPGRYTVGGRRQGFRDVQVEFTITGEPLDGPIVVSCEEPI